MINYILKLEFNSQNKMILAVQYKEKDVALLLYEDCHRKGELIRDFSYLCPKYYASEEEWDDERNLITITIFPLVKKKKWNKIKEDLEYLAESLIEQKPAVNHKIEFCKDSTVKQYYSKRSEDSLKFIKYLLSHCENIEEIDGDENILNHLMQ